MDSSVLIALIALLFAVGSAWWMYIKRGRIRASKPPHFALLHDGTVFFIRIPFVVKNTGGRTLVIHDLRLWLPETSQTLAIPWRRTVETLLPVPSEPSRDPVPFPVKGHDAASPVIEFGAPMPGFSLDLGRHYLVRVEAMLADRLKWEVVLVFQLELPNDGVDLSKYQRYSNLNFKDDLYTMERVEEATNRFLERMINGGATPKANEKATDREDDEL